MNSVIGTLSRILLALLPTTNAVTGGNGSEIVRITNGQVVHNLTGWEFIVAIRLYSDPVCSGIVLSSNFTLTSCGCAHKIDIIVSRSEDVQVVAGTSIMDISRGQWLRIKQTTKHPYCSNRTIYQKTAGYIFDYAVLEVDPGFTLNSEVKPIVLPSWDQRTFEYQILIAVKYSKQCEVAGWGKTQVAIPFVYFSPSPILLKKRLMIVSWARCSEIVCRDGKWFPYCKAGTLVTGKLCASPVGAGNSCQEDEGGPLVCDGYVYGIVSHIGSCGEHNEPNYYARLDIAIPFIVKYVKRSKGACTIGSNIGNLIVTIAVLLLGL